MCDNDNSGSTNRSALMRYFEALELSSRAPPASSRLSTSTLLAASAVRLRRSGENRYDTSDPMRILQESIADVQDTLSLFQARPGTTDSDIDSLADIFTPPAVSPDNWKSKLPAASCEAISGLPRTRLLPSDKEKLRCDTTECAICYEKLVDGVMLSRLPCGHTYHWQCAISWLSKNCSCPECRFELPTADPKYEISRIKRTKGRKTVECNCHPSSGHRCFFVSDDDGNRNSLVHHLQQGRNL